MESTTRQRKFKSGLSLQRLTSLETGICLSCCVLDIVKAKIAGLAGFTRNL